MKQKAKISWLKHGDENTSVFHQSIKQRAIHNRANMICLNDAIIIDPQQIQDAFYKFYSHLFYIKMDNKKRTHLGIAQSGPRIDQRQQNLLNLSFSNTEIKDAIWSIPDGKASKLDGFNIKFYKAYWEIVGPDVIAAV